MRSIFMAPLTVSLAALMAACSPSQPAATDSAAPAQQTSEAAQTESERLNAWFADLFAQDLARSPETQTQLGEVDDLDAYGRWDAVDDADAAATNDRR